MAECAMPLNIIASPAPKKYLLRRIPNPPMLKKLSQTVFTLDFRNRQTADTRQRPAAVGHRHRHHDLVGARRIVVLHLHALEMATHECRVLVAERNIERRT